MSLIQHPRTMLNSQPRHMQIHFVISQHKADTFMLTERLAEGLTLGQKGGLQWQDMWQVLAASAVASPILKAKSVQLAVRDYTPTFTVEQMAKDLDLILAAGAAVHAPLLQTSLTQQLMHAAMAQGDALLDYAAIIRTVEHSAGLPSKK